MRIIINFKTPAEAVFDITPDGDAVCFGVSTSNDGAEVDYSMRKADAHALACAVEAAARGSNAMGVLSFADGSREALFNIQPCGYSAISFAAGHGDDFAFVACELTRPQALALASGLRVVSRGAVPTLREKEIEVLRDYSRHLFGRSGIFEASASQVHKYLIERKRVAIDDCGPKWRDHFHARAEMARVMATRLMQVANECDRMARGEA